MNVIFKAFAVCFILLLGAPHAHAIEPLTIDVAESHIDITTGFSGASIVIFGVRHGRGDVAIVVEGPRSDVVVRRKDNVLGAWINRSWMRFMNVPLYYDYALAEGDDTSREIGEFGVENLVFETKGPTAEFERYKNAFIRGRRDVEFYPMAPETIEFIGDELFRTRMSMPANVPQGEYTITALLIDNKRVVYEKKSSFKVGQVGFNSGVYSFSKSHSFFYAMLCVFIAVLAGWLSHKVARRA
jgi:uncharacterized protein (TIGR02186 family)